MCRDNGRKFNGNGAICWGNNNRGTIVGARKYKKFGALVQKNRERLGFSILQVSKATGIHNKTLANAEDGKAIMTPDPDCLLLLSEVLLTKTSTLLA